MNTRLPFVTTITPPLTTEATLPSRISPDSLADTILSQPLKTSTSFFESLITPSLSSVFIITRSRTSPMLTASSGFVIGSDERSSKAITPVCFLPTTSTNTSVGVMLTTVPFTTLLFSSSLNDSSSISSKVASPSADALTAAVLALSAVSAVSTTSSVMAEVVSTSFSIISSDMVFSTSLIITAGVEAPAVTPTTLYLLRSMSLSSAEVSIRKVSALALHTSLSLQVFDECLPPMTMTASASFEREAASSCLSAVALHIVL